MHGTIQDLSNKVEEGKEVQKEDVSVVKALHILLDVLEAMQAIDTRVREEAGKKRRAELSPKTGVSLKKKKKKLTTTMKEEEMGRTMTETYTNDSQGSEDQKLAGDALLEEGTDWRTTEEPRMKFEEKAGKVTMKLEADEVQEKGGLGGGERPRGEAQAEGTRPPQRDAQGGAQDDDEGREEGALAGGEGEDRRGAWQVDEGCTQKEAEEGRRPHRGADEGDV